MPWENIIANLSTLLVDEKSWKILPHDEDTLASVSKRRLWQPPVVTKFGTYGDEHDGHDDHDASDENDDDDDDDEGVDHHDEHLDDRREGHHTDQTDRDGHDDRDTQEGSILVFVEGGPFQPPHWRHSRT